VEGQKGGREERPTGTGPGRFAAGSSRSAGSLRRSALATVDENVSCKGLNQARRWASMRDGRRIGRQFEVAEDPLYDAGGTQGTLREDDAPADRSTTLEPSVAQVFGDASWRGEDCCSRSPIVGAAIARWASAECGRVDPRAAPPARCIQDVIL
jgi:hypothetical protein